MLKSKLFLLVTIFALLVVACAPLATPVIPIREHFYMDHRYLSVQKEI